MSYFALSLIQRTKCLALALVSSVVRDEVIIRRLHRIFPTINCSGNDRNDYPVAYLRESCSFSFFPFIQGYIFALQSFEVLLELFGETVNFIEARFFG